MYFISGYLYTVVRCDADSKYWLHSLQQWAVLLLINRDMAVAEAACPSAAGHPRYRIMVESCLYQCIFQTFFQRVTRTDTLYVETSLLTIQQPILQFNTAINCVTEKGYLTCSSFHSVYCPFIVLPKDPF